MWVHADRARPCLYSFAAPLRDVSEQSLLYLLEPQLATSSSLNPTGVGAGTPTGARCRLWRLPGIWLALHLACINVLRTRVDRLNERLFRLDRRKTMQVENSDDKKKKAVIN